MRCNDENCSVRKYWDANLVWKHLSEGCKLCFRGRKLVLFVTGKCPLNCFYCPISSEKRGKDVVYTNERPVTELRDLIEEAELMDADGAGITGGEPLMAIDRTLNYIRELKRHFGGSFHIHLYTSGHLLTDSIMKKLVEAGLDEIRFHPVTKQAWANLARISKTYHKQLSIGIEVPVLPYDYTRLIQLVEKAAEYSLDFVNLNELEVSDSNINDLLKRGIKPKESNPLVAEGSEETAKQVLEHVSRSGIPVGVHYCSARYKNEVQMALRYYRRAQNVARPFELVADEGLLMYLSVEGKTEHVDEVRVYSAVNSHVHLLDRIKRRVPVVKLVEETPTWKRITVSVDYVNGAAGI